MAAPNDTELRRLAVAALASLARRGWRVALAESCTGGWVAKTLTDIPGSSAQFDCSFVTYANRAKQQALAVPEGTLASAGAVSRDTVLAMAAGARVNSQADLAVAVSGVAGPDGGTPGKPVGFVWFGWQTQEGVHAACSAQFTGDRDAVRRHAVGFALRLIVRESSVADRTAEA